MVVSQIIFLIIFALLSLFFAIKGLMQSKQGNTNTLTPYLFFLGAFVWADAAIFGLFWLVIAVTCLVMQDWLLFLIILSVFWVVRSAGEVIYWFNEQFSTKVRNKPKTLHLFKLFPNESIWFVYQIIWQCVLVLTLISSVYLFNLWL